MNAIRLLCARVDWSYMEIVTAHRFRGADNRILKTVEGHIIKL